MIRALTRIPCELRLKVPVRIREMGSRYFFICAYVWLEKYFSRGDYRRQ